MDTKQQRNEKEINYFARTLTSRVTAFKGSIKNRIIKYNKNIPRMKDKMNENMESGKFLLEILSRSSLLEQK